MVLGRSLLVMVVDRVGNPPSAATPLTVRPSAQRGKGHHVDPIFAITSGVIDPTRFCLWPTLVLIALGGCRDAKPPSEHAAPPQEGSTAESPAPEDSANPAAIVRRYYDAISAGNYDSAYALWEQSGQASGKTRAEFARGFAQTERTVATVRDSVRIEAAAGSQYATVPVTVEAVLRGGERQHFAGTYTLRRAMVDGATPEQRRWRIYSAAVSRR
jgi:hypothetical protein